jgi:hypothetical protein
LILNEIHSNKKCNRIFDRVSKIHFDVKSMIEEIQVEGFFFIHILSQIIIVLLLQSCQQ